MRAWVKVQSHRPQVRNMTHPEQIDYAWEVIDNGNCYRMWPAVYTWVLLRICL